MKGPIILLATQIVVNANELPAPRLAWINFPEIEQAHFGIHFSHTHGHPYNPLNFPNGTPVYGMKMFYQ